jgi:hypothetical protein
LKHVQARFEVVWVVFVIVVVVSVVVVIAVVVIVVVVVEPKVVFGGAGVVRSGSNSFSQVNGV